MTFVEQVKSAARGRWIPILTAAGLPEDCLTGKNCPCPKCGGEDRFAVFSDVAETGGVNCRQCHNTKNGDGIATVQWWRDCTFPEALAFIAEQIGLDRPESKANGKPRIVATYDYRDEAGELLFQAVRYEPKDFRQRRPKEGGGWNWSVKGVRVVPYRLPELLAEPDRPVVVCEGEKDVDNLSRLGVLATCNAGGAGKWTDEHAEFLRGRRLVVIGDNDEPGRQHAQQVALTLQGITESVLIVELPGLPDKGDASDWIAAGGTKEKLKRLIEATPEWTLVAQPWGKISSFDELKLSNFPTHALPDALRDWVEAESLATQTPADLAGLLVLAVVASTIARRVVVEPRPGWREPVNLFVAVLLEPGNRKSAVFYDALKPLRELEDELIEAAKPEVARAQSERRQSVARLKKLEKIAGEGTGTAESRQEAEQIAEHLAGEPEPVLPRLLVDDSTSEKLAMILEQQGGRIASMSPEGDVFDLMAGLYSKSGMANFGVYLKGHAGDDLITDRVSRESIRVERPALTCGYAIQPQVIEGLADNTAFRGRGLLARFLYAAPKSWIGERAIDSTPVSDTIRDAYGQVVRALANVEGEHILELTTDASAALRRWESEIELMLADGGQMEAMRDWGAKLAGATLRLAAVLHCTEHSPAAGIEKRTIVSAIEIACYLIPHAEVVLNMMQASEEPSDADARYVLRWIERHERREFTKSEAQHHGKRRFPKADAIDPALAELAQRGYIRLRPAKVTGPGRPPSPSYEVNPAVFEKDIAEKRSHNSHNSANEPESGNCGNIGSAFEGVGNEKREKVTI